MDVIGNDVQCDLAQIEQDHRAWLLDGPQGSGKTYFIEQYLKPIANEHEVALVQLNAFEHDFEDEPLFGMAAAIARTVDRRNSAAAAALGVRAWEWAASKAPIMGKVVGVAAGPVVGGPAIRGTIGEHVGKAVDQWWKQSAPTAFEEALGNAVDVLTDGMGDRKEHGGSNTRSGKCILVIDDLDRCRPTFALKLLERVLHVFPVRGLAVLVVSDRAALEGAASRAYGRPSGQYYMDKFFRACFEFQPVDAESAFRAWFADYAESDVGVRDLYGRLAGFFGAVAQAKSLTLRQMNDAAEHACRWGHWGVLGAHYWVVLASVWIMKTFPEGQACIDAVRRDGANCEEVLACLGTMDDHVRGQWKKVFENRETLKELLNSAFGMEGGGSRGG